MKHRKDEPGFYCDSELRKMRSKHVPEMYIALRSIGKVEGPFSDSLVHKSFLEQVSSTMNRFYTKEQTDRWEEILKDQEENTKELPRDPLGLFTNPLIHKARKMPFPIRWFGKGWKALRKKKP